MRKEIFNIEEMSDSKEIYGQRPNPFIIGSIYCIVALLLAALAYSFLGKIEMVATANGIVRPNDGVSTVSSLVSGKITSVSYTDGQIVKEGDPLFTIDTSEKQLTLDSLLKTQQDDQYQADMDRKFLDGINEKKNPFSQDPKSKEYPYYIKYKNFALSLKNTKLNGQSDESKVKANIQSITSQVKTLNYQIQGLTSYENSVKQGKDLAAAYPEFENQYLLYVNTMDSIDTDYNTHKKKIELDLSGKSNQYYLSYYQDQVNDYRRLIDSIGGGVSEFDGSDDTTGEMLYQDYQYNLDQYQSSYDNAKDAYDYYLGGGTMGDGESELFAYDGAMLEGYAYYKNSVLSGRDMFDPSKSSIFYRSLYEDYQSKYGQLSQAVATAQNAYNALITASPSSAASQEVAEALAAKNQAVSERDAFKKKTLASIDNTILQVKETIAQKKVDLGTASVGYNISTAKMKMDNAGAAVDAYRNKALGEYNQTLADLQNKLEDAQLTHDSTQDKADLLNNLKTTYQQSKKQQYYKTVAQVDSLIQTAKENLASAQSTLNLDQIAYQLDENNRDDNGQMVSVSSASVTQISNLLNDLDALKKKLDDVGYQIKQTKEQIGQGRIRAEQTGTLNAVNRLVKGNLLSSGVSVATIIPLNESQYKVQLYVSNADMGNMKVGDKIKYNIVALPSSQYGTVSGKVQSISKDALEEGGQYTGYFLVEGTMESGKLKDKSGNTASISIGMQVQAKIVTEQKSMIRYLLEKINLF